MGLQERRAQAQSLRQRGRRQPPTPPPDHHQIEHRPALDSSIPRPVTVDRPVHRIRLVTIAARISVGSTGLDRPPRGLVSTRYPDGAWFDRLKELAWLVDIAGRLIWLVWDIDGRGGNNGRRWDVEIRDDGDPRGASRRAGPRRSNSRGGSMLSSTSTARSRPSMGSARIRAARSPTDRSRGRR